jgi:pimeloyl-ACP methyl ester carboxylesterase
MFTGTPDRNFGTRRLEIFDGSGHLPHCEQPGRFCDVLSDFMETTSASTTSGSH